MQAGAWIGPYQVERELGRGGMAVVLLVRDREGRPFALKLLQREGFLDPENLARFELEARAMAALDHPHVLRVRDCGSAPQGPYLVLDYVAGESLGARLKRGGPLEPPAAISLVAALCDGVEHAHRAGVLHRDIKPDNVLLREDGHALLGDFGLARRMGAQQQLTRTGEILGTPATMAPEQVQGDEQGPPTDVYGLGGVLYAALTGRAPFAAPSTLGLLDQVLTAAPLPPSLHSPGAVSPGLDAVVLRCLAKEPAERYPSAAALRAALSELEGAESARGGARAGLPVALVALVGLASLLGVTLGLVLAGSGLLGAASPAATVPPTPARTPPGEDLAGRDLADLERLLEERRTGNTEVWAGVLERARREAAEANHADLRLLELDLLRGALLLREGRQQDAQPLLLALWEGLARDERAPADAPLLWHELVSRCARELEEARLATEGRVERLTFALRAAESWTERAPTSPQANYALAFLRFVLGGQERLGASAALLQAVAHAEGSEARELERAQVWLGSTLRGKQATAAELQTLERLWREETSPTRRRRVSAVALGTLGLGEPWRTRRSELWAEEGAELAPYLPARVRELVEAEQLAAAEALCARLIPLLREDPLRFTWARASAWAWLGWGRACAGQRKQAREAFQRSCGLRRTAVGEIGLACLLWEQDMEQGRIALRAAYPLLAGQQPYWTRIVEAAERVARRQSLREALEAFAPKDTDPRPLRAWLGARHLELVTRAAGSAPLEGWKQDLRGADWRAVDEALELRAREALDAGRLEREAATRLCWVLVTRAKDPGPWEVRGAKALAAWTRVDPVAAAAFAREHPFRFESAPPRAGLARRALAPLLRLAGESRGDLLQLCRLYRGRRLGQVVALARPLEARLSKHASAKRLCHGLRVDAEHLLGRRNPPTIVRGKIDVASLARLRQLAVLQAEGAALAKAHCVRYLLDPDASPAQRAEVRQVQVQAMGDLGEHEQALAVIGACLPSLEGHDMGLRILRVHYLRQLKRSEEALSEAKGLALNYPTRLGVQLALANLLISLQQLEEAEGVLARCRALEGGKQPAVLRRIERAEERLRAQSGGD